MSDIPDEGALGPATPAAEAVARYLSTRDAPDSGVPDSIRARGPQAVMDYLRLVAKKPR